MLDGRKLWVSCALAVFVAGPVTAQCLVLDAAQAALDREIEMIQALATDVDDIFNGPAGCIDSSIFSEFDLSIAIPDLAGMLTSFSTDLITDAISAAQTRVCQEINDMVEGTIGTAQETMASFSSGLTDELQGALDNGWEGLDLDGFGIDAPAPVIPTTPIDVTVPITVPG